VTKTAGLKPATAPSAAALANMITTTQILTTHLIQQQDVHYATKIAYKTRAII